MNLRLEKIINYNKNNLNYFIFFIFIFLTISRHFDFFLYPRFWAEEGSIYFIDAYTNGIKSILHPHLGYYSLIPNIATYLATFVPLKYAPLVTTIIAFIIQIIPFYLIIINNSIITNSTFKKLVTALIIFFVANTGEIWLNTITSQFHFIIITFLILLDLQKDIGKFKLYFYSFLILIAGLSGIPANVVAPLFLYTYLVTKNKHILYFFSIFILTIFVQIVFLFISLSETYNRFQIDSFIELFKVIGRILLGTIQHPFFQTIKPFFGTILLIPLIYVIFISIKKDKFLCIYFCGSFFLVFVYVIMSLHMIGGGRYYYAPNVIFVLGLFHIFLSKEIPKKLRIISILYVIISIIVGIYNFPIREGIFDSKTWKKWEEQIEQQKYNKKMEIKIYPQWQGTNWKIIINNENKN